MEDGKGNVAPPPDGPSSYTRIGQHYRCTHPRCWGNSVNSWDRQCKLTDPPHKPQLKGSLTPYKPVFVRHRTDPPESEWLMLADDTKVQVGYTIDNLPDTNTLADVSYIGIAGQDCQGVVVAVCVHGYGVLQLDQTPLTLGSIIYCQPTTTLDGRLKLVDKSDASDAAVRVGIVLPSSFPGTYTSVLVAH